MVSLLGTISSACAIEVQYCPLPGGGEASYDRHRGSVVLFTETTAAPNSYRTIVVECQSRQALAIAQSEGPVQHDYWDAEQIMIDAVSDDEEQTLDQLKRRIARQTGIEAERFELAAEHCGCDLPNIPPPVTYCPPM